MAQLTIRLKDVLADAIKQHAAATGRSANSWVVAVLNAAVDPAYEDTEADRTRARLARAGLLAVPAGEAPPAPDPALLERARKAAGKGTPLSDLVTSGRD